MKKDSIQNDIADATKKLLDLARDLTFNTISNNCLFIISEIKNSQNSFYEDFQIKLYANRKKKPRPLTDIISELENLYSNLYDVNLYVYKAEKRVTIIEIQYYPRSSLDQEYRKKVETRETMLHCKVPMPVYVSDKKEKFDINWPFGTLNHKWKMFWHIRKLRNYNRKHNFKM